MRKLTRMLLSVMMVAALLCAAAQAEGVSDESLFVLASASAPLTADDVPPTLKQISTANSGVHVVTTRAMLLREEALAPLYQMTRAAAKAGRTLYVRQAYRSYEEEARRYELLTGMGQAAQRPGESSYQTGLSVTLVGEKWKTGDLTAEFASSAEAKWLREHAAQYGFALRYPEGKEEITGWSYEPWHYRYVGVAAATMMAEQGLCLEELVALSVDLTQDMPLPEDDFDDEEPEEGPVFVADGEDDDVEWDESAWELPEEPMDDWEDEPASDEPEDTEAPTATEEPVVTAAPRPVYNGEHGVPPTRDLSMAAPEDIGPDGDYEIRLDELRP